MLELREGFGICKKKGNLYTNAVRQLNAALEESIEQTAELEAANAELLMREQVRPSIQQGWDARYLHAVL
jgi:hypothetical protein